MFKMLFLLYLSLVYLKMISSLCLILFLKNIKLESGIDSGGYCCIATQ